MKNEFIPYEEALALKGLGFDESCFMMYNKTQLEEAVNVNTFKLHPLDYNNFDGLTDCITAPLYQQAFRWLRVKCGLWVTITYESNDSEEMYWYIGKSFKYGVGPLFFHDLGEFNTYEEAQLACLKKLIEILNQNKEDGNRL